MNLHEKYALIILSFYTFCVLFSSILMYAFEWALYTEEQRESYFEYLKQFAKYFAIISVMLWGLMYLLHFINNFR